MKWCAEAHATGEGGSAYFFRSSGYMRVPIKTLFNLPWATTAACVHCKASIVSRPRRDLSATSFRDSPTCE